MRFQIGMVLLALALGAVSCGPSAQEQALSKNVTELQAKLETYSSDLETAKTQAETAKAELATAQQALAEVNKNQDILLDERDTLQAQLATLQPKLEQTQLERDQLRTDLISSAEEIVALKQAVPDPSETISSEAFTTLQTKLEQTERERNDLRSELISSAEDIAALKVSNEDTVNDLGLLQEEMTSLKDELEAANSSNTQQSETSAANQTLQREVTDLQGQITDLQQQLTTLQPRLEQTSRERDDLRAELITSAEEIVALKQQLNPETSSGVVAAENATSESATTQSEAAEEPITANELEVLQTRLTQTARERNELRAELLKSAEEIVALKQAPQIALETMTSERDALLAQAAELQGDLETLTAERDDVTAQLSTSLSQINILNKNLATAQEERDDLQVQLTELQAQLEENERQNEAPLASRTSDAETAATEMQTSIAPELEQTDAATSVVSVDVTALNSTRMKALELSRDYQTLLDETRTKTLTTAQQTQLRAAQQELAKAQQELANLTGAKDIYTVKRGDSLFSVAASYYNEGNDWPRLLHANAHLLGDNPDDVYEGIVLIIPQ